MMSDDLEVCPFCGIESDEILECAECGTTCCSSCEVGGLCVYCDESLLDDLDDDILDVEDLDEDEDQS